MSHDCHTCCHNNYEVPSRNNLYNQVLLWSELLCGFVTANMMKRLIRCRWKFCRPMLAVRSRSSCSSHHL